MAEMEQERMKVWMLMRLCEERRVYIIMIDVVRLRRKVEHVLCRYVVYLKRRVPGYCCGFVWGAQ